MEPSYPKVPCIIFLCVAFHPRLQYEGLGVTFALDQNRQYFESDMGRGRRRVYNLLIAINQPLNYASRFNPSRWLNLPKTYNSTFSMLSFIAGPHACIGRTMAIIEMKAVLASVIANFEFEPAYAGQ